MKEITLGVMGGGQLGRMFVHTAQRMGYFTTVLDPDPLSPAGRVSHHHIQTAYTDPVGLQQLSERCVAITTEFENVPARALAQLAQTRTVSPGADGVAIAGLEGLGDEFGVGRRGAFLDLGELIGEFELSETIWHGDELWSGER